MNVEYRDASYFEGSFGRKKVKRVEAMFGQLRVFGPNKKVAKGDLEIAIRKQCENANERRYLTGIAHDGKPVTFAMYYNQGWCYDIVRPDDHGPYSMRVSSTAFNDDTDFLEAWNRMHRHFEQYTERAA